MKHKNKYLIKKNVYHVLVVAFLLLLMSCSSESETKMGNETAIEDTADSNYEVTKTQFQASNMTLGKMEMASFHEVVKANGMLDVPPENRAMVSSYFGGIVKDIKLLPGERVKKGQVLFILENPDYVQLQQDFLEAKGQLTYLKSDYERQKNLAQDNVSSQKNFLKAESDYIVTKVKVESLSKKLALMNIIPNALTTENIRTTVAVFSPINGYVTEVAVSKGTFLNPSQLAVSIIDIDRLHVELNIFEKDLSKVKIGQPILFRVQNDKRNEYRANVHLINKIVDAEKRSISVHGDITHANLTTQFNAGMYVEADIITSSSERMALPQNALVDVEGRYYVLMLQKTTGEGYTFVKKEVKTGLSNTNHVEILNTQDFNEDTEILINGSFNLITE